MNKQLIIGLDMDDVLVPCVSIACDKLGIDPDKITEWDISKCPLSEYDKGRFMRYMRDPALYKSQEPYPGAVDFVNTLIAMGHDVVIVSATLAEGMSTRMETIKKYFPNIKSDNVLLGARKDLVKLDMLLDDSAKNLIGTQAKYPVMMTRHHNMNERGFHRVSSYDEVLNIVKAIQNGIDDTLPRVGETGKPGVILLVGPSGSGKSFISDELIKDPRFAKFVAVTDRPMRENEVEGAEYRFVSTEEFVANQDHFLEHTVYSGHRYGADIADLERVWDRGLIAVKPMDISGALAFKKAYPDRVLMLYVRRNKEDMIRSIVERKHCSNEEKTKRIASIDREFENEFLCDFTISNNGNVDYAVKQILRLI